MTPVRLSNIWYRRLYGALFIGSLAYLIPYVLELIGIIEPGRNVATVGPFSAAGALVTAIASAVLFFVSSKVNSYVPSLLIFGVYATTTALFIQATGGTSSPYIMLWSLVLFVAPLFGAYGWIPGLVIIGTATAAAYLNTTLDGQTLITIIAGGLVPLFAGVMLWRDLPDDAISNNVKTLANQLSEVANRSEIVINAIGDGVIAVDGKGTIQLINPAAQEILGWGKQDALMLSYKSILKLTDENNQDIPPASDPLQQVLNTNQQARGGKLIAVTSSGKKLNISLVVSPIGDPGAGAIAVFRDVTNERTEEREQAEFISTASHEMRTPVASIEGYLGLALNPNTATIDQKARDFILKAHEAAQHLGRLFQDLLDVSKSEDGRMQNTPKVVDIVPFADTIVQGLRQKATDKGLNLVFVPTDSSAQKKIMPVYYVNLDNDHIREVLDNLVENAIKYTPQGEVRVDVNGTEDKVIISIKDSGLGIPTEDIPHLFQKFYRVNNMDRQSIGGTGLGLYLCRRLVEAMQGRIWVESVFGSGSTFFVELPRLDSKEAEQLQQTQAQQVSAAPVTLTAAPITPVIPAKLATPIAVTVLDTTPPAPTILSATPTPTPAPSQAPAPTPTAPLTPTGPVLTPVAPIETPPPVAPPTQAAPATTVPRGETLTRDQINERVRQLEELAKQQRGSLTPPPRQ